MSTLPVERDERAEHAEHGARGADRGDVDLGHERVGGRAGRQPGQEVHEREPDPPELVLHHRAEDPERVHVEEEVQQPGVQEHRADEAPGLAERDPHDLGVRDGEEPHGRAHLDQDEGVRPIEQGPRTPLDHLEHVDGGDRDEQHGRDRGGLGVGDRDPAAGALAELLACLLDTGGAVVADRRRPHAVGADRTPAPRAVHPRLDVGMPVARLDRGRGRWHRCLRFHRTIVRAGRRCDRDHERAGVRAGWPGLSRAQPFGRASSAAPTCSGSNSGPQRSRIEPSDPIRYSQGSVRSSFRSSQSAAAWFTTLFS